MYSLFLLVYFYLKRGENGQNTGLGVSRVSNFFCCKGFMHVYNVIFFYRYEEQNKRILSSMSSPTKPGHH